MAPSASAPLNHRHNYRPRHLITFTTLPLPSRAPPSTCSSSYLLYTLLLSILQSSTTNASASHSRVWVLSSSSSAAFQALISDFDGFRFLKFCRLEMKFFLQLVLRFE